MAPEAVVYSVQCAAPVEVEKNIMDAQTPRCTSEAAVRGPDAVGAPTATDAATVQLTEEEPRSRLAGALVGLSDDGLLEAVLRECKNNAARCGISVEVYSESDALWVQGRLWPPTVEDSDARWMATYSIDGRPHRKRVLFDSPHWRAVAKQLPEGMHGEAADLAETDPRFFFFDCCMPERPQRRESRSGNTSAWAPQAPQAPQAQASRGHAQAQASHGHAQGSQYYSRASQPAIEETPRAPTHGKRPPTECW